MRTATRRGLVLALTGLASSGAMAGPVLPPPGPVSASYKTLTQVEPRTPLSDTETPGDSDSVYRISQPGSYYLTANLTAPAGKHAIEIDADGVTLDLNGFVLTGASGSLSGVRVAPAAHGYIIRNGHVRGFGQDGIDAAPQLGNRGGLVEGIVAAENGRFGIAAATTSVVRNCAAQDNGGNGIRVFIGAVVEACTSVGNGGTGIEVQEGSVVTGCVSRGNDNMGIYAGPQSLVERCTSSFNAMQGIFVSSGASVLDCAANNNQGAGIYTGSGSVRIEGNNVSSNAYGIQVAGTVNWITRNSARSNTTANYQIVSGNRVGTIVTPPLAGAISGNTGGASGTTDPWSNIAY